MSGKQPMLCLLPSFAFNVEVRELAEKGTVKGKVIHKLHTNKRKCRTRHETFGHDGNALKWDLLLVAPLCILKSKKVDVGPKVGKENLKCL